MERESMAGDAHVNCCVDSFYPFVSTLFFSPAPASSQTKWNNNHQKQHGRGCGVKLPSYSLPNFSHKEFINNMGLDQMKWKDISPPQCFCFPQQHWKISSNKLKSRFVKWVNTHKGCWYHSWQDHNLSLMLSNQMKWQDVFSPCLILSPAIIMKDIQQ